MIIFLDDNESRHKKFRQNTIGIPVRQAYNAKDLLDILREIDEVDLIMLDHDLNCETTNQLNDEEEDGRWVASRMVEEQLHTETTIIIHSMNAIGANIMEAILREGGYKEVYQIQSAWMKVSKGADGEIKINDCKEVSDDINDYK